MTGEQHGGLLSYRIVWTRLGVNFDPSFTHRLHTPPLAWVEMDLKVTTGSGMVLLDETRWGWCEMCLGMENQTLSYVSREDVPSGFQRSEVRVDGKEKTRVITFQSAG